MRTKKQAIAQAAELALAHVKTLPAYSELQPSTSLWVAIQRLISIEVV